VYEHIYRTLKSRNELLFLAILQLYSLPVDCARELFKPWKDVASLLDSIEKIEKFLKFSFFVGDIISGVGFRPFWLRLCGPWHKLLEEIFWLKFLLET